MNTELNKLIQTQVFKMLKAKEDYDLALKGKIKFTGYKSLPCFNGLSIQEVINILKQFEESFPEDCEIGVIEADYEESYVVYYTYETDEDYKLRLSNLKQTLENERKVLDIQERTNEFYKYELNKV